MDTERFLEGHPDPEMQEIQKIIESIYADLRDSY